MNTKWNLLMVIALLAMLVGGNVGQAHAQSLLTFFPEALPNAIVGIDYQQILTVSGATRAGTWSYLDNTLPPGLSVGDYQDGRDGKGAISGIPAQDGTFTFSVYVRDYYDPIDRTKYETYSHEYTLVVEKATTTVLIFDSINPTTYGDGFEIKAHSHFTDLSYPPGTFAFYLDGSPVTGCEALPVDESNLSTASCWFAGNLAAGDHTIRAVYSPTDSLHYNQSEATSTHTVGYKIDGTLFRDANMNGTWDTGETALGAFYVGSDRLCDRSVEQTALAHDDGTFSLPRLSPNIEYCLQFMDPGANFVQTTPTTPILLDGNKDIPVGVYFINVQIDPDDLPAGEKGVPYEQQITVSGGIPPYTLTVDDTQTHLPDGMSFDATTGMLSGTPTQAGDFYLALNAVDSMGNAAYQQKYGLLVKGDAEFLLTSSSNPSVPGEEVTFTLSATGDAVSSGSGPVPPVGLVTFLDGSTAIANCSQMYLNVDFAADPPQIGDFPVTCTTSALAPGNHQISATYTDLPSFYDNATLTLDQQVGLAISPRTLPDGTYAAYYFQQLIIGGGSGSYTILWVSGTLPQGIILWPTTGELKGYPGETGTFTFFVQVQDNNDPTLTTTQEYTLVIGKEPVEVTVWTDPVISKSGEGFDIWAASSPFIQGVGTFAFYLDDAVTPIPGCEAVELVAYGAYCAGSADLAAGEHTIQVLLTPSEYWSSRINPTAGIATHTVGYRIGGTVFEDLDQDGAFGAAEPLTGVDWTIYLDQDCDGTVDQATGSGPDGTYEFASVLGGHCYRISATTEAAWSTTATLNDITSLSQDITNVDIGAYPAIYLGAGGDAPKGDINMPYSFQYPVGGGGTAPYTFALAENANGQQSVLPAGLTLSESGLLSGTPTEGGHFELGLQITDANGAHNESSYTVLSITLDGNFSLTSSSNPSMPGEAVTFTLTATGDYVAPGMGAVPPIGYVAFLDGQTPIEGCTEVLLNVLLNEYGQPVGFGNAPASCTTAALGTGTHTITASFTDPGLGYYHNATRTLQQAVNSPVKSDLKVTLADSKDPIKPGATLVYTMVIKNNGPELAEGLSAELKLDPYTAYSLVSAPRGWTCTHSAGSTNGTVTCTAASLASGKSATIKVTVMVDRAVKVGRSLVATGTVTSTTFDPVLTNNAATQKTLVSR